MKVAEPSAFQASHPGGTYVDVRRNWAGAAGHGKSFRYLPDRTVLYPCAWIRVAMVSVSFIRYV
jgi:hypothetical protein